MHRIDLRVLLEKVADGALAPEHALEELSLLPYENLDGDGEVRVDHHRELRSGVPEVVLGQWKSAEQIIRILRSLGRSGRGALATRVSDEKAALVTAAIADAVHHPVARSIVVPPREGRPPAATGVLALVAAGTSDIPVAEEAAVTLDFLGHPVERIFDVGVAGMHRLLAETKKLRQAAVAIVVAGMEGALPSVVAGLVDCPVIAVPTSVGYGVSAGGFAALLGMLSSCAPGVMVVNIDNGFGAAVAAARINRVAEKPGVAARSAGESR